MNYKKLESLVEKHNRYIALRSRVMDEKDFQDVILLEDGLKIDDDDTEIFIEAIKQQFTKVIVNLEQEIDSIFGENK